MPQSVSLSGLQLERSKLTRYRASLTRTLPSNDVMHKSVCPALQPLLLNQALRLQPQLTLCLCVLRVYRNAVHRARWGARACRTLITTAQSIALAKRICWTVHSPYHPTKPPLASARLSLVFVCAHTSQVAISGLSVLHTQPSLWKDTFQTASKNSNKKALLLFNTVVVISYCATTPTSVTSTLSR